MTIQSTSAPQPSFPLITGRLDESPAPPRSEHTLILGWNDRVTSIIQLLDQYVAVGSEVMVVAKFPTSVAEISADTLALKKQTVRYQQGNPADRAVLNRLDLTHYDHAVVLCNSDRDFGCT